MYSTIISEKILNDASNLRMFQGLLPQLILNLVLVSIKNPKTLRFPYGEEISQHGYDGLIDSNHSFEPFIPLGQSIWELSTEKNIKDKITKDYTKRTEEISLEIKNKSFFVFVTPRTWSISSQEEWKANNCQNSDWKSIKIIDATMIVQWLSKFPEMDNWLAKKLGYSVEGVMSINHYWESIRKIGSPPEIKPEVFITGREKFKDRILQFLEGQEQQLVVENKYPDSSFDFVVASIILLKKENKIPSNKIPDLLQREN